MNDEAGVFLFAAKDYQIKRHDSPRYKITSMYLNLADAEAASDGLANLSATLGYYERKYCALKEQSELYYVVSPRGSGAYVFGNIIVIPGQGEFRFPKDDYRYVEFPAHEAAHLYWDFASFVQNEDWVIEGIAAYSAFSFLIENGSAATKLQMLEHQLQELLACRNSDPVTSTPAGSADFGANRGIKPAWLYYCLNGESKMLDTIFTSLYREYSGVDCISARIFLSRLTESLTPADSEFLMSYLRKPGWTERDVRDLHDRILAEA